MCIITDLSPEKVPLIPEIGLKVKSTLIGVIPERSIPIGLLNSV